MTRDDQKGFVVLPKPWIVERFFAHLMRTRRLARDYERRTTSADMFDRLRGLRPHRADHAEVLRYTQPDGRVMPLLQVAPSKLDAERVFPISPEAALRL